jgi:hypothetical protein
VTSCDYVKGAGSPVAAAILEAVHEDLITDGQLVELLPSEVRFGDLVGLRIMAAVHRLAITRVAPLVALHLPTLGGTPPTAADERTFASAVVAALLSNPGVLQSSIAQTPKTPSDCVRSAALPGSTCARTIFPACPR